MYKLPHSYKTVCLKNYLKTILKYKQLLSIELTNK